MNSALTSTFKGSRIIISKTVSANYTFDDQTEAVNVNALAGPITITLPAISTNSGRLVTVRKIDTSANVVTIQAAGSDLYQGGTSATLGTQWALLSIDNDGAQWHASSGGGSSGGGGGGGLAAGTTFQEVLYANASLEAAGDPYFKWDNINKRLAVGQGFTVVHPVELGSAEALVTVGIRNTNVGGYAGLKFYDSNNIEQLSLGVGNTGASPSNFQGPFLSLATSPLTIIGASNATIATLATDGTLAVNNIIWSKVGGIKFPDNTVQTTAVSAGGTLTGGTTNAIPFWSGAQALGNTSATWDGTHFNFKGAVTESAVGIRPGTSDVGGYLTSTGSDELFVSGGAAYNSGQWIAKAVNAGIMGYSVGLMRWYTNNGLTSGAAYVPTLRMSLDNSGNLTVNGIVKSTSGGFTFPDNTTQITAATPGASGTGATNQIAYWSGTSTIAGTSGLTYDPSSGGALTVAGTAAITSTSANTLLLTNSDSSGNNGELRLNNNGGGNAVSGLGLQLGGVQVGALLGFSTTAFGLRAGINVSADTGGSVNIRVGSSSIAWFDSTGAIFNTGNLKIGTSTDNGTDKLQVTGKAYFSSKVGIGLANPGDPLDVFGTPTIDGASKVMGLFANTADAYSTSPTATIEFATNTNNGGGLTGLAAFGGGKENATDFNASGYAAVYVRPNTGGVMTEVTRFASTGAVLVGTTTNPNNVKLRVAGVIESSTGGIRYPDGTTQTSASISSLGGTAGSGTTNYLTYWTDSSDLSDTGVAWIDPVMEFRPAAEASSGTHIVDSTEAKFLYSYWDGGAAVTSSTGFTIRGTSLFEDDNSGDLVFINGAGDTELMRLNCAGIVQIGSNVEPDESGLGSFVFQVGDKSLFQGAVVVTGKINVGNDIGDVYVLARNDATAFDDAPTAALGFSLNTDATGSSKNHILGGILMGKENDTDTDKSSFLSFLTYKTSEAAIKEAARFSSEGNFLVGTLVDDGFGVIQANGIIESKTGGFRFPDGTIQTTAGGGGGGGISGLTAGRIVYSTGSSTVGDDSAFLWDPTNNRLKVGSIAGTHPVELGSGEATKVVAIRSSSATGTPGFDFYDDSNVLGGSLGLSNSGATGIYTPGRFFWNLIAGGLDFVDGTNINASIASDGTITGTQFNLDVAGTDYLQDDGSGGGIWNVTSGETITFNTDVTGSVHAVGALAVATGRAHSLSFDGAASGPVTISSVGTNSNIAILPSGTGRVLIGTSTDDTNAFLQVNGSIESKSGGFRFPDATTQTTAASASGVSGAVQFSDGSGVFVSDNGGIHFDATNHRLGLGNTTPGYRLDLGTTLADVKVALFNDGTLFAGLGFQANKLIAQLDATTSSFVVKASPSVEVARITGTGQLLVGTATSSAIVDIQVSSAALFEVYNSAANPTDVNAVTIVGTNTSFGSFPTLTVGSGAYAAALQSKNSTWASPKPTLILGDGSVGFAINDGTFRSIQDDGAYGWGFYTKTATTSAAKRFSITGNATTSNVIVQNAHLLVNTTTDSGSGAVIQANGVIESTSGGIRYPDGSVQTTASTGLITGLTAGRIPYAASGTSLTDTAHLYWDTSNDRLVVDADTADFGPLLIKGASFNDITANGMGANDAALGLIFNTATDYDDAPKSGLTFGGHFDTGNSAVTYYGSVQFVKQNATDADAGSYFSVSTRPTGAATGTFTTEAMRINAAGNMLLGTVTDDSSGRLIVSGAISATGSPNSTGIVRSLLQLNDTTAFGSSPEAGVSVGLYNNATPTRFVAGAMSWGKENNTSGNSATFARIITRSVGTGLTEAMRITSNQKILIGTTTDDGNALVQVNGVVESLTGGFRFPDGTVQTTTATATSPSGVSGAVQFSDGAGVFSSNDGQFHWDNSLHHLLVGTNTDSTSGALLQVNGKIESRSGGIVFPDGSVQTSSASGGAQRKVGEYAVLQTTDTSFYIEKLPSPSVNGTVSAAPAADSSMMMLKFLSAATTGDAVGISGPYFSTRPNYGPVFSVVVRTDAAVTNQRHFIGLTSADLSAIASLAGLDSIPMMAFRYDTALGDTAWQAVTSDGSAASATTTGVAVAANTTYTLKLDFSTPGTVRFTVNNATAPQVSKTTNLPSGTVDLGIEASLTTLTTTAQALFIERVKLDQN